MRGKSMKLAIPTALLMIGCQVAYAPEADETVGESTQAISRDPIDPPDDPPDPPVCVATPGCSFSLMGGMPSDPLATQLRCGQQYRYFNGHAAGVLGGIGTFCPDSPTNRSILHAHHLSGFLPNYCDDCVRVPSNKLFVFWSFFVGPGCPSGCIPGEAPGAF